jgi:hypothetical protein
MKWFLRDGKAVLQLNEKEMHSHHIVPAKELANELGISEVECHEMAHRLRLPFFVSGAGGFAVMSRDVPMWRAAAQQTSCCGE